MLGKYLDSVKKKTPLIHNITNYVTVNDVANALLACGASPIMSDEETEVEEITSICGGLNINIGTLNSATIPSMYKAGKKAVQLSHPVVLDPVGAGASKLRTDTAIGIMQDVKPNIIRGNMSEIKTLALGSGTTKGVDADVADAVNKDNLSETVNFIKEFAKKTGRIIAVTGAVDLISDGKKCFAIYNGRPEMGAITGTGCQLSALIAAFITAEPDNMLESTTAAVAAMGLAGEIGMAAMNKGEGNSSYRNHIIDAINNMDGEILNKGIKAELF